MRNERWKDCPAKPHDAAAHADRVDDRRADRHAKHPASSAAVHADRDGDRDRDDAAGLPYFQVGAVDPDIGPVAFDGALEKAFTRSSTRCSESCSGMVRKEAAAHGVTKRCW